MIDILNDQRKNTQNNALLKVLLNHKKQIKITFNLLIITTNHIYIGAVYIISGLIGGSIGFGLSIILRLELALPGFIPCSSLQYNANITFHGIFMISSMIMPILIGGFGNILLPLMPCSSDMIFPRLNALSL